MHSFVGAMFCVGVKYEKLRIFDQIVQIFFKYIYISILPYKLILFKLNVSNRWQLFSVF